ncbi:bifunctional lysylphosphatidylglycerol synthetase/lysine--tRNA ligase LysX [Nocardiopsis mangrovi]|uniref:Bifunctional lysylphosphatidylglycerol synthetase/lysine--tRNA ligase LysX n=1 Tax=Nocardiopsis mangrovi TaxID=1179818 RepID=A0ABV9DXR6_9ACTN
MGVTGSASAAERPGGHSEPAAGPEHPERRRSRLRRAVPPLLTWALCGLAVLCALRALLPGLRAATLPLATGVELVLVPVPANLAYALFLALLAGALARRKRPAFWIVAAYLAVNILADLLYMVGVLTVPHLAPHASWGDVLLWTVPGMAGAGLLLAALLLARDEFRARVQPGSARRALGVLVLGLAAGVGLGYALVAVFHGTLAPGPDQFTWAVERVLGGAFRLSIRRTGSAPGWVNLALGLFGALALFAAVVTLFLSQRRRAAMSAEDEARVRALLDRHGERDSLGYFATRRDKSVRFSPSGKAAVAYRVVAGTSLAGGDPIGDPEAWPGAVRVWLDEARAHAWTPAVMGASEAGARCYARAGLRALHLGDEAVLRVADFTLEGRAMRVVRQAAHRVERAGYTARVRRHGDIAPEEMRHITDRAAAWRDTETERGFSMALGRLGDPGDGGCVLVEALAADGRLAGFLSFVPWGDSGISLDLMRRDRTADNGLVEFMVAHLMRAAPRFGVRRVSLNFAVFRAAFEEGARIGAGPVLRAWRRLLLFLSRWWQLEAMYRSNVKYRPEWVPRFVCFGEARDLANVALASGIAEGFVPSPGYLLRRGRTPPAPADRERATGREAERPAPARDEAVPAAPDAAEREPMRVPEQTRVRLAKADAMRAAGLDPYPVGFARTATCAGVRERHAGPGPGGRTGDEVAVAGRVTLIRDHGGVCFATLTDGSGDLQLLLTAADLGVDEMRRWRGEVDIGDHVGVRGPVAASRHGEPSVRARTWTLTAKCLRPLPGKRRAGRGPWAHGHRPIDLALTPETAALLRARSAVTAAVRSSLAARGFLEVETPVLHPVHGGAEARPFTTHLNAYDLDVYLRIAPELYLKRLCVGGLERIFEVGRCFRNEGVSPRHHPEFTMLEAYQAYADHGDVRRLAADLVREAAAAVHGAPVLLRRRPDGSATEVDISGAWPVTGVHAAVSAAVDEQVTPDTPLRRLRELAGRHGVALPPAPGGGEGAGGADGGRGVPGAGGETEPGRDGALVALYERLVEARTTAPAFYTDFPAAASPLARRHRSDPRLAERWDLVVFGMEIGTGYSEQNDPVEQRRRLTAQSLAAAAGDPEAMELDEDFLSDLEYAMPPTGGLGLGVDRLVMAVTGRTIRETLPFAPARPGAT